MPRKIKTPQGREIAYHKTKGAGPGIVFLGGFMSDMTGTKAQHLQAWAKAQGRAFVRFDYSGHGESAGQFTDGCIGEWAEDAAAVLEKLTDGPQVLVGSSMGGWISLLLAKRMPDRIAGLVTIAAAPDFTEDGFLASFPLEMRRMLQREGVVYVPSDYGDPYPITKKLIEDGRDHLVLRSPLELPFPVRFLQGDRDEDVSVETANKLFAHAKGEDIELTLLKNADHRFSDPQALKLIEDAIQTVLARV